MYQIYDLEVLKNYFLYVGLSLEGDEFNIFEISRMRNDLPQLLEHLNNVKGQIGFNNLNYDSQIQEYILRTSKKWKELSGEEIAIIIYSYSQKVIDRKDGEWPDYNEKNLSIKQLDLFRVWHYNNMARSTSLKKLQYSMDWYNIEDMPIKHYTKIESKETADSIIDYCKNDCLSTRYFYRITLGKTNLPLYKGINKIQLRKDIQKEFGMNCINFDDVKIGDQINKLNYCNAKNIEFADIPRPRDGLENFTFGDCFPNYEFKSKELNEQINKIKDVIINSKQKQEFKFKFREVKFTIAKGGIHSEDVPRVIKPTNNELLIDCDIGSQYPNAIRKRELYPRHLGKEWLNGYSNTIDRRIEAKKLFKQTKEKKYKSLDEAYKLSLNGGSFGRLGLDNNWQYDPLQLYKCTIGNQIEILMLIEDLLLNDIKIVSANTK